MNLALLIHKLSLVLTVIFGVVYVCKKTYIIKTAHYVSAIVFVGSILFYLFADAFSKIGYLLYALLLILTFFSPKFLPDRGKTIGHVALFIISVIWLIVIHLV